MDLRLIIAVLLWIMVFSVALYPVFKAGEFTEKHWVRSFLVFCVLLAVALPAWRWRSLMYNGEINVDEGSEISKGLKYLYDPIPWRSVDGITCGPLSTWVILWAPLLGLKLSYFTIRITGILLIFCSGVGVSLSLKEIVGRRFSMIAVLPALTLFLTTLNFDFVTCALEYLPVALSSWAIYFTLSYYGSQKCMKPFLVGLLTGAMPFTKLQSAPSAVFIFLICGGLVFLKKQTQKKEMWKDWVFLALGGVTVPILVLVPVIYAGMWSAFLNFYIFCGVTYKSQAQGGSAVDFILKGNPDFGFYLVAMSVGAALLLLFVRKSLRVQEWVIGLMVYLAYCGILVFSVFRSGFNFPHYLIFLVMPTVLLFGWLLRGMLSLEDPSVLHRHRKIAGAILGAVLFLQGVNAAQEYGRNPMLLKNWGVEQNAVVPVLLRYAKPGDSMAIWGWANKLHAFTGIRPATRFIGTTYVTDPSPNYNRHRELFLEDLKKDNPKLFVDAIDEFRWPTWPPGALARHDMLPELAEWVRRNYTLVADVQTAPNRLPVRIYLRKES